MKPLSPAARKAVDSYTVRQDSPCLGERKDSVAQPSELVDGHISLDGLAHKVADRLCFRIAYLLKFLAEVFRKSNSQRLLHGYEDVGQMQMIGETGDILISIVVKLATPDHPIHTTSLK